RLREGQGRDGAALFDDADLGLAGGAGLQDDLERVHEAGPRDVALAILEAAPTLLPAGLAVAGPAAGREGAADDLTHAVVDGERVVGRGRGGVAEVGLRRRRARRPGPLDAIGLLAGLVLDGERALAGFRRQPAAALRARRATARVRGVVGRERVAGRHDLRR